MKSHASMNRIFRTIWSAATQSWQAVPETAKSKGGSGSSSTASAVTSGILAQVALGMMVGSGAAAQAPPALTQLPTGALVVRGNASISQSATAQAAAMTVRQSSQKAVINWNTFNLGQAASINFAQPNAQAVTLNRVLDNNPSQIFGRITAPGQVFITNANGVYFAPTSSVDVGSLVATTHSISDDNFMAGKSLFERNGATGQVVNEGHITADLSGYIALLAPEVRNSGVVLARAGAVVMAAGESITLNFEGGGNLLGITTTPSTIATLIENRQAVQAPGGLIILSAVAADKMRAGVIKNTGSLEASSLVSQGGKILLEGDSIQLSSTSVINATGATGGGTVLVGGDWQGSGNMRQASQVVMDAGATIDASATVRGDGGKVVLWSDVTNANGQTWANGRIKAEAGPSGGNGGQIETSGHFLNVDGIQVSTNAVQGSAGNWLLDPYDINISSTGTDAGVSTVAAAPTNIKDVTLNAALVNGSVTLQAGAVGDGGSNAGNITLYPVSIEIPASRTLSLIAPGEIKTDSSVTNEYPALAAFFFNGLTSVLRLSSGSATPSGKLAVSLNRTGMIYNEGAGLLEIQTKYPLYNKEVHISSGTLKFSSSTGDASLYGESYYANTIYISDGATLLNPSFTQAGQGQTQASQVIAANGATLAYDTVQPNDYGPGTILLNGNLTIKSTTPTITLGSVISGTGGLTITGGTSAQGSTVVMNPGNSAFVTHANTYTGTTTIDPNNTLQYGPTGAYGSWGSLSAGPVVNNGTLAFGLSAGVTIPNAISGTGAVSGTSTSRVTLSGALSYTGASSGGLYVAGPTLATPTVSGAGTSQPTVSVTIPDGTALGTLTQTFTPTSSTGQVTGATVTTTLTSSSTGMAANGSNWTYTPTLTASGNLTYTFTVTKTGGGLQFSNPPTATVSTTAVIPVVVTPPPSSGPVPTAVVYSTTGSGSATDKPLLTWPTPTARPSGSTYYERTYTVFDNGTQIGTGIYTIAAQQALTPFSYQVTSALTSGSHVFTATMTMPITTSGVTSTSTPVTFTLGTFTAVASQVAALTNAQVLALTTADVAALTTAQVAALTTAQVAAMTTAQVAALTTSQVAAMTTAQVAAMTTAQVPAMTTAQVAAMTTGQVAAMTTAQVPAMTTAQVAAMTTAQVAAMTPAQVAAMSTTQVAAMTTAQVPAMTTTQVAAMTTTQVAAMTPAQVAAMSTTQVAAMTTTQVPAMTTTQVAAMTTTQVAAMTTAQVAAMTTAQVAAMTTAQVTSMTTGQVAAMTTAQITAMTTAQVASMSTAQVAAMTTLQVPAMTTAQVVAMTTTQVAAMTTAQFASMTTAQVAAMTTAQVPAMTTAQVAAMTTTQVAAMTTAQVAAMSTTQVAAMTTTQVPAMTTTQVAAMTTAQVAAMTTAQVAVLSATQLGALVLAQASALTALQVAALTTTQLAAMTSNQMATLTAAQSAALSPAQVLALTPSAATVAADAAAATAAADAAAATAAANAAAATAAANAAAATAAANAAATEAANAAAVIAATRAAAIQAANAAAAIAAAKATATTAAAKAAITSAARPSVFAPVANAVPPSPANVSGLQIQSPPPTPMGSTPPAPAPVANSAAPTANTPATSANAPATARDAAPTGNTTVASTSVPATSAGAEASGNNAVAPAGSPQAASAPVASSVAPTANTPATSANAPAPARDAAPAGNTTVASASATGAGADASGNNAAVPAGSPQGASAPVASSSAPTANAPATSASAAEPGRDATPAGSATTTVASSAAPIGNATPSASNSSTANSAAPVGNSSTGTSGAASTSLSSAVSPNKVVAVKVNVVRPANAQSGGVVTVAVPKGTAGTNAEFAIPVPIQVLNASTTTNQEIKISLVNNAPAPSWVKYSPETKSLLASAMPAKSLPIKLIVTVGNYRTMVELLETTKR